MTRHSLESLELFEALSMALSRSYNPGGLQQHHPTVTQNFVYHGIYAKTSGSTLPFGHGITCQRGTKTLRSEFYMVPWLESTTSTSSTFVPEEDLEQNNTKK